VLQVNLLRKECSSKIFLSFMLCAQVPQQSFSVAKKSSYLKIVL